MDVRDIVHSIAVFRLRLHFDLEVFAVPVEVVDVAVAEQGLKGGVDSGERNIHFQRLFPVDCQIELRQTRPESREDRLEFRRFVRFGDNRIDSRLQSLRIASHAVLQHE